MGKLGPIVALIAMMVAACSAAAPSASGLGTGPPATSGSASSLRTFPIWRTEGGVPVGCDAVGVPDPVYGLLDGNLDNPTDPVWLTGAEGDKLSIVWPEGFTARFAPLVAMFDETGAVVANAGDTILFQVSRADASGAFDDPYYASGILLAGPHLDRAHVAQTATYQGCYPREDPDRSPTP